MRIGSFIRQSFCDWEGRTSAVVFTKGCNFLCGFCHNPELVIPSLINKEKDLDENEILTYLDKRKNWLDGLVVTGGEPTLQSDLTNFLHTVKNMGYPIKLDTNGYKPEVLNDIINKKLIDLVALDIKTILKDSPYQKIIGKKMPDVVDKIKQSLEILRKTGIEYQLRTTLVPGYHEEKIKTELNEIFKTEDYKQQEFRDGGILSDYY